MIIKQGCHSYAHIPFIGWDVKRMTRNVMFTKSCIYDIGQDQSDVNKLFGIGYYPHHHNRSIRFGWRWNLLDKKIDILAYWYFNGVREFLPLTQVEIGKTYRYDIIVFPKMHRMMVKGTVKNVILEPRSLSYSLHPYFGGNQKAPHDIEIIIKK